MRIEYKKWKPQPAAIATINAANEILAEYAEEGHDLTLRQLYYQFVARDLIPNNQRAYKRLGDVIQKARDAGYISWQSIVDRLRGIYGYNTWDTADDFIHDQADRFHLDPWRDQERRVQVWVEKDALSGVIQRAANRWRVDYFPNKGYVSASSIWTAARTMMESECNDWLILHLGDHDPSGIDMSRDIEERLNLYTSMASGDRDRGCTPVSVEVRRIALNMDQVRTYNPPPNPAKLTDSRVGQYLADHGDKSWELDALEPSVIVDLIGDHIEPEIDDRESYDDILADEERLQDKIRNLSIDDE